MKTSKFITTTSLVALLSSFGLMACGGSEVEPATQDKTASLTQPATTPAPDAMKPEARDARDHGPGMHRFGPPTPEKMLERFDANKNGTLEAAELPERMQEHIGEIDTSGDGVVTKDELAAHFKARFAEHAAKFAERAKERFDKKDANHDGVLDQTEVGTDHWARMSVADANGDQKLSPDELKAAFESGKLKPPMRGERGERGHGERGERGGRWQHGPDAAQPVAPGTPAAPAQ